MHLTKAQKASQAVAREQKKAEQDVLDGDIKRFLSMQEDEIAKMAMVHNIKVEKVRDLLGFNNYYKKHWKPTLHNAILHFKAMEINQGACARIYYGQLINIINPQTDLPPGQKTKLAELKALGDDDDDSLKNLSKEQEEELINKLLEHRDTKKNGLRANNAATAHDILCTGDAMTDLVRTTECTRQPPLSLTACILLVEWLCPPHRLLWLLLPHSWACERHR
jgi:hypothetical protein